MLLQLCRIAALDFLYRDLTLILGDFLLDLGGDELLAAAVDVVATEVAETLMLRVGLDLLPQGLGIFCKMLLNDRGVII